MKQHFSPVKRLNYYFKNIETLLKNNFRHSLVKDYKNEKLKKNSDIEYLKKFIFDFYYIEFSFYNIDNYRVKINNNLDEVLIKTSLKFKEKEVYEKTISFFEFKNKINICCNILNTIYTIDKTLTKDKIFDVFKDVFKLHLYVKEYINYREEDDKKRLNKKIPKNFNYFVEDMIKKKEIILGIPEILVELETANKEYEKYKKYSDELNVWRENNKDLIYLYNKDYDKKISKETLNNKLIELKIPTIQGELCKKREILKIYSEGLLDSSQYFNQKFEETFLDDDNGF